MSPPQIGYIKSIYGIIADSIKEEIKILKSDYFAYYPRQRPNFEILNARGMRRFKSLMTTEFMSNVHFKKVFSVLFVLARRRQLIRKNCK